MAETEEQNKQKALENYRSKLLQHREFETKVKNCTY